MPKPDLPPALTREQRDLARRIAALHAKGEPLNVFAVRRRHPDLLDAVMAVRPYWGWKKAIEAAGLDYGTIRIELLDTVTCLFCDRELGQLAKHLATEHGTSSQAYREEFPGAELVSETKRSMRHPRSQDRGAFALPHWESVWSREYVLDRIVARWELGHPITHDWVEHQERELGQHAFEKFGGWEHALMAASLHPELVRLRGHVRRMTDAALLTELSERHASGLPLTEDHVRRTQPPLHDELGDRFRTFPRALARAGVPASDVAAVADRDRIAKLLDEARRVAAIEGARRDRELRAFRLEWDSFAMACFGTWTAVAEAAGIEPERLFRPFSPILWDREGLIREVIRRHRLGIPFHQSAVMQRRHPTNGADEERDPSFAHAARRIFGSFRALIEAAVERTGDTSLREYALHPTRGQYPSVEAVVEAIRARVREGGSMLAADVTREDGPLISGAKRFCGGWHKAIRTAGFDPREVGAGVECHRGRLPRYPHAPSVVAEIQRRAREGLPLNANALQRGPHRDVPLLLAGRLWFTQWEGALRAAGIDPESVRPN